MTTAQEKTTEQLAKGATMSANEVYNATRQAQRESERKSLFLTAAAFAASFAITEARAAREDAEHANDPREDTSMYNELARYHVERAEEAAQVCRAMLEMHNGAGAHPAALAAVTFAYEYEQGDPVDSIVDCLIEDGADLGVDNVIAPGGANFYYNVVCQVRPDLTIAEVDRELQAIIAESRDPHRGERVISPMGEQLRFEFDALPGDDTKAITAALFKHGRPYSVFSVRGPGAKRPRFAVTCWRIGEAMTRDAYGALQAIIDKARQAAPAPTVDRGPFKTDANGDYLREWDYTDDDPTP